MLPLEEVAEVRKATFRGEIKTKTICNGHADVPVLPAVYWERNLKPD